MPSKKRSREDMDEGARKKLKQSPGGQNEGSPLLNTIDISSDYDLAEPSEVSPSKGPADGKEGYQALRLLHEDFDALRSLVTCKICERLLYEPYVLSCGHTYCYSCLCTWFQGNKKKTCPNCREVIRSTPAPAYVIKEMTNVFVARAELLPDGETLEQHAQWQKEEAAIVRDDKNDGDPSTGGLFKGCFSRRHTMGAIYDREDNVERCPSCSWEVEDGVCSGCGYHVDDDIDSGDEISDDLSDGLTDDEIDQDAFDDEDADFGPGGAYDAGMYGGGAMPGPDLYELQARYNAIMNEASEDELDEDEDDTSLNGFVARDDSDEGRSPRTSSDVASDLDTASSTRSIPNARRRRIIIDSDDAEDPDDANPAPAPRRIQHVVSSDDEDESNPAPQNFRYRPIVQSRRVAPTITVVDSDDDDLNSESEESELERSHETSSTQQISDDDEASQDGSGMVEDYGFSPLQPSIDDDHESEFDGIDDDENEQFQ